MKDEKEKEEEEAEEKEVAKSIRQKTDEKLIERE